MSNGSTIDFKALHIIWLAMIGGTALYTVVVYGLLVTGVIDAGGSIGPEVINVAGIVAMAMCGASLVLRRKLIADIPADGPPEERMGRYAAACIAALGLAEAGALFVIVLAIVTGMANWALAAGGASVFVMLLQRPKKEELGGS